MSSNFTGPQDLEPFVGLFSLGGGALLLHRSPEFLRPAYGGHGQRTGVAGSFVKAPSAFMNTGCDWPMTGADLQRNSAKNHGNGEAPPPSENAARQRPLLAAGQHTKKAKRLAACGCIQAPDPASGRASPGLLRQAGEPAWVTTRDSGSLPAGPRHFHIPGDSGSVLSTIAPEPGGQAD